MPRSGRAALAFARELQGSADAIGLGPKKSKIAAEADLDLYDAMVTAPRLRAATRKLFVDRHYAQAVGEAFKLIDNMVQEKSGLAPLYGFALMTKAFTAKSAVLKLNDLRTESDNNEQDGYMHIFAGTMLGIRNPRAHKAGVLDEPRPALEMLVLANHLMRALDRARRVRRRAGMPK